MHCWKILNIRREYGTTRLILLSTIIFILVFAFTFPFLGQIHPLLYKDDFFWLFLIVVITFYPIHKLCHYYALFDYRKSVKLKLKFDFPIVPFIEMRIKTVIPKRRYIFTLITPFIVINSLLIFLSINIPQYSHYTCLLLAYHCSICFIDILYVKNLILAPKNALVEETPKGYEILVPPNAK